MPRDKHWDPEVYEAEQAALMRARRLREEEYDHRWNAKWAEECAKPIGERQYFSFAEIAQGLACNPRTLAVDPELAARIVGDLSGWVQKRQFAAGEVATLSGDPADFRQFDLGIGEILVPCAEALFLARGACRRYVEARPELPGGAVLLRDWFTAEAAAREKPNVDRVVAARRRTFAGLRTSPPSRLKPFWENAEHEIMRWLDENGCPEPGDGNQAKLERHIAGWLAERGHEAGEATIRSHVSKCIGSRRAALIDPSNEPPLSLDRA
jgi:hypothetical protein